MTTALKRSTSTLSAPGLPDVEVHETADEEMFDCPPAWYLVLNAVGMSVMTALTVAGAFFFCLASPASITNHCWLWDSKVTQALCTASTVAFWTYPVVCCVFVGLIFAKNMMDARMYYEFLLHKIFVGYERRSLAKIFNHATLPLLLLYAVVAMTSIGWHANSRAIEHSESKVQEYVYGYMTYLTPVISFVATLVTKWTVQYFLIPLCEFLEDFKWARAHIDGSDCFPFASIHHGYLALEHALDQLPEDDPLELDTSQMVALVGHYCKEHEKDKKLSGEIPSEEGAKSPTPRTLERVTKSKLQLSDLVQKELEYSLRNIIYWPVRLFFHKRLKDERSKEFQMISVAYIIGIGLSTAYGLYVLMCCTVTALQVEYVVAADGNSASRILIRYFSLLQGRDLPAQEEHSIEEDVAKAFRYVTPHLRAMAGHLGPGM
mmetsp:Transcript_67267/g.197468  ORF Transcript_67267/g.197468 Transcript_67267/m.197468 type:complete len:433 (-) Transcript_67267:105-1403(-)